VGEGLSIRFLPYIARIARWAATRLKVSEAQWNSADIFKDPTQTHSISSMRTRKSAGENQEPNPKPSKPKPADIHPEPAPAVIPSEVGKANGHVGHEAILGFGTLGPIERSTHTTINYGTTDYQRLICNTNT